MPACPADAERVLAGADPYIRTVQVGAQRVPYWQGGQAYAPWAQGYYSRWNGSDLLTGALIGGFLFGGMGNMFAWARCGDGGGGIGEGIGGDGRCIGGDAGGDGGGVGDDVRRHRLRRLRGDQPPEQRRPAGRQRLRAAAVDLDRGQGRRGSRRG